MRKHKLKAQIGYKRRYIKCGSTSRITDNILKHQFNPPAPNQVWVSDITTKNARRLFVFSNGYGFILPQDSRLVDG